MSEYEKAKTEIVWVEDYEFPYVVTESVENLIQAADKEIEHLQDIYKLCNHDRALLQKDAATKNAELARLREALNEAKRRLRRGIVIPKDIADSIDEALKSNDS